MSGKLPRLVDVIVCDDLRQETSGKYVVVGMYTGPIMLGSFPALLPKLVLMTKWQATEDHPLVGDVKLQSPNGSLIGQGRFDLSPRSGGDLVTTAPLIANIQLVPFSVDELGLYSLHFRPPHGRRWRKVFQFEVAQMEARGTG